MARGKGMGRGIGLGNGNIYLVWRLRGRLDSPDDTLHIEQQLNCSQCGSYRRVVIVSSEIITEKRFRQSWWTTRHMADGNRSSWSQHWLVLAEGTRTWPDSGIETRQSPAGDGVVASAPET